MLVTKTRNRTEHGTEQIRRRPFYNLLILQHKKSDSKEATRIYGQIEVKASCSTSTQSDIDQGDHDVLDLDRMADKFESRYSEQTSRIIKDAEINRYIQMHKVDFKKMRRNDRILKQAYDLLFRSGLEKYPHILRQTEDMLDRLESQPHLYCPYERDETTYEHVTRWLDNHTTNPVAELRGFTSRDTYEPQRFIPTVSPRVSNSDTNVLLGKRKRNSDTEEDDGLVHMSSSDTILVCEEWCRPVKYRRRS